jgi:hypothetical protein
VTHDSHGGSGSDGHGSLDGTDVVPFSMSGGPRSDTLFWALFLTLAVFAGFGSFGSS